jgi:aspartate carbamoyltransferase catalytic subunit
MKKVQHVLSAKQPEFDREWLEDLYDLTQEIREASKTPEGIQKIREPFIGKAVQLFFDQPSTRTHHSFLKAIQTLGMGVLNIQDVTTSSMAKDEDDNDTFRTLSSFADALIIRSKQAELAGNVAKHLDSSQRPIPIISAGSGTLHHPTQAFLDIYTMMRSMRKIRGLDGQTFAMVGDLKRGRTIHSNCHLLSHFKDIKLIFVSIPELSMPQEILDFLGAKNVQYEETDDFDRAVSEARAIYMTRTQSEYGGVSEEADHAEPFIFSKRHLEMLRTYAFVMHPLPRGKELARECDNDPRIMIWRQVRNGMWVRTALLYHLLYKKSLLSS